MYYFIVNPNSRSGAGLTIWRDLREELKARRVVHKVYFTQCVGHAKELAAKISRLGSPKNPATLVAVGGDGTICEVLTGITDLRNVILGFIPTGSGNDFCRSMKLHQDPLRALNAILKKEHIRAMDVPYIVTDNFTSRFGISTGLGFDAAVCHTVQTSRFKKILNRIGLGKLIYVFVALRQILFMTPAPMTLYLDQNRRYSYHRVYFASVMNQKYEGGGFRFCPLAKSNDGILDVIVVEGIPKVKLLLCLPLAFFGKHTHIKGIHIFRCRSARLDSAVPLPLHTDGEIGGICGRITVGLEKNPIKVIV